MTAKIAKALGPVVLALAAACSGPDEQAFEPPRVVESTYTETGDFDAIRKRGQLRLLLVRRPGRDGPLPRPGSPVHDQLRAASQFARSLDLEPVVVPVDEFPGLVPALRAGRGDLIVANQPILPGRRDHIRQTVALDRTRQVLVKRADDPLVDRGGLAGRTITVGRLSPFWDTARRLQDDRPGLRVAGRLGLSAEGSLDLLTAGEIELTIVNANQLEAALAHDRRIAAAFPVSDDKGIAWGVRRDAQRLKAALDRYITQRELADLEPERRLGDLPEIKRSGTLRVATRNDAASYFVWRGRLMGFEYELAKRFAEQLGVRLEVVVADGGEALREMLRAGRADIAAAFLIRGSTDDRGLAYSRPYHFAVHQVVTDRGDENLQQLTDLPGRTFHVRKGSDAWRIARGLREQGGLDVAIEEVPPNETVSRIISRVADGRYDLTIAPDHTVKNAMAWNDQVRPAADIGKPIANRWAFRADSTQLRAAADEFLEKTYRGTFYNVLYSKYFTDHERVRRFRAQRVDIGAGRRLSPYDDLLRQYASEYGFDWRLIAAQAYQESSFEPAARSWVGAVGLLQVMPRTARQIGVTGDLEEPETNLRAGIQYLDWLRERFEEDLSVQDRTWFILAAYNAGTGHVRDARRLAAELGLDPDRWFENVEKAMLKLSEREHFRDATFGYVRGEEPVQYVRAIRDRYQAYQLWTQDCWPSCPTSTVESAHPSNPPFALAEPAD